MPDSGDHVLLIASVDEAARTQQLLVQRNHEQVLDRRRLLKEIEKKEILLDCVVHDLSGPVGTLIMNLEHIGRKLSDISTLRPAVDRALSQAKRQLTMVRSISHVFEGELGGGGNGAHAGSDASEGVDIIAVVHEMTDLHRPPENGENSGCRIQFRLKRRDPISAEPLRVAGSEMYLCRVVENLLLNALRHVPPGRDGEIVVTVEAVGEPTTGEVEVRVEDNGPGVEPTLADEMFRPFPRDEPGRGSPVWDCISAESP